MRVTRLRLAPYGAFSDRVVALRSGLTLVLGVNEAGKSTVLDGLSDLLWGIPLQTDRAFLHGRPALRLHGRIVLPDGTTSDVTRRSDGLYDATTDTDVDVAWRGENDSRERWRRSFGLTHAQLREGGLALFRGEGDLAQLVFAARSGHGVRGLLERLSGTADLLYKDHRNYKSAQVRQANVEYERLRDQAAAAMSLASQVEAAALSLGDAERDLATARRRAASAADRLDVCEVRSRIADTARTLHDRSAMAARLRAAGTVLNESDLARWVTANGRLSAMDIELSPWRAELVELRDTQASITVDDTLLADDQEIRELHLACEARLADGDQANESLRQSTALERAATELTATLVGPHDHRPTADILAALHVPADLAAQLDDLAHQCDATAMRVTKATEKLDSAMRERDSIATGAADGEPTAVVEAYAVIEAEGSAAAQRRDALRRGADAQRRRDEYLTKAGLPAGAAPTGVLPSADEIDGAADILESRNTEHKDAQRQLVNAERALAKSRTKLDAIDAGAVPTADQLLHARAIRNDEVTRLVRAWLAGAPPNRPLTCPPASAGRSRTRTRSRTAWSTRSRPWSGERRSTPTWRSSRPRSSG